MKFDNNNTNILFSNTEIPDIFFTEYLPNCNGDYIKLYLYLIFLSKNKKEIKLTDLSNILNISLETLQNAIHYWEELGVITKQTNGYTINNLQEIELYKLYNPKLTSSPEDIKKNTKNNQKRIKAIEHINNNFFQGVMSSSWYNDIDFWFSKYNFDENVMIALFSHCLEKSALSKQYIQAVAEAWSKAGIQNFSDLEKYFEEQDKFKKVCKNITKKLKLSRSLTTYDEDLVRKWLYTYSYDLSIIDLALKQTTGITNINFKYIDAILSCWYEKGLKTIEDIQKNADEFKKKQSAHKNSNNIKKTTNYNNYEQRNFFDLNQFYANK